MVGTRATRVDSLCKVFVGSNDQALILMEAHAEHEARGEREGGVRGVRGGEGLGTILLAS